MLALHCPSNVNEQRILCFVVGVLHPHLFLMPSRSQAADMVSMGKMVLEQSLRRHLHRVSIDTGLPSPCSFQIKVFWLHGGHGKICLRITLLQDQDHVIPFIVHGPPFRILLTLPKFLNLKRQILSSGNIVSLCFGFPF